MPVFSYRAINDDSKEIRGSIEAADLDAAKAALEVQHLEIVEVTEATRLRETDAPLAAPQLMTKTTFVFEGTDTAGTVRRGTMQAETKYQAFERLKQDQKLLLTMLSPLGVTPQYRDMDLENWQRRELMTRAPAPTESVKISAPSSVTAPVSVSVAQKAEAAPKKTIGFTLPDGLPKPAAPAIGILAPPAKPVAKSKVYHPLISTLRLYAGWLLGWYGLFVALGYYSHVRVLPWEIPFVEAFFVSPLIFSFIVAMFLFLLLGAMHRAMHGRLLSGIALTVVGIVAFAAVRISM